LAGANALFDQDFNQLAGAVQYEVLSAPIGVIDECVGVPQEFP